VYYCVITVKDYLRSEDRIMQENTQFGDEGIISRVPISNPTSLGGALITL
jgi:hypothetical protein